MAPDTTDETVVLEPQGNHTGTIIMMHGRGSSGTDFSMELFMTRTSFGETLRDLLPGYRWVFPCSAERYSVVFKESFHQWYDIYSLVDPESQAEIQAEGIKESLLQLKGIVAKEATLSPTGDVVLGGISQGFSIALLAVLSGVSNVSTLIGFSSWLPFKSLVVKSIVDEQQNPQFEGDVKEAVSRALSKQVGVPTVETNNEMTARVFLAHCANDNTVDIEHGRAINGVLEKLGYESTWIESPNGGHWINAPHGMDSLKSFIKTHCLNDAGS